MDPNRVSILMLVAICVMGVATFMAGRALKRAAPEMRRLADGRRFYRELVLKMLREKFSAIAIISHQEHADSHPSGLRSWWGPTMEFFAELCDANVTAEEAEEIFLPDRGVASERIAFADTYRLIGRPTSSADHPQATLHRRVTASAWFPVFQRFLDQGEIKERVEKRASA